MAVRRRLGQLAELFLKQNMAQEQAKLQSDLVAQRQKELSIQNYMQSILGEALKNPSYSKQLQDAGLTGIGGVPLPTGNPTTAMGPITSKIASADNPQKVPTDADILAEYAQQPWANTGGDNPQIAQMIQQAKAKRGQQDSLLPPTMVKGYNPITGATEEKAIPGAVAREGFSVQTGPTTQQGIAAANQTEAGTRGEKVRTAEQTAGAEAAAKAPYDPTYFESDEGIVPVTAGPHGGPGAPMPGLRKGAEKTLPVAIVQEVAGLNTAEREGVKVLDDLAKSGLSNSDNFADPRFQKWMATKFKVSTNDLAQMDIQQRTAYVQAQVLKTLMSGRPSKWVADLFTQHLPQGEMTGRKLFQVMRDVMEQIGEKREETGNVYGTPMQPPMGISYQQWLQMNGVTTPAGQADPNDPAVTGKAKLANRQKRP